MFEKDIILMKANIKVFSDYEKLNNEDYAVIVSNKVNLILELVHSLYKEQVILPDWKNWVEPVLYKFCYHVSSMLKLFGGTSLPYEIDKRTLVIFDEPSIIVLFRVVLENYLTFFYLFINKVPDAEKEFRSLVWRFCGLKQRCEFKMHFEEGEAKQVNERKIVDSLKNDIMGSLIFNGYAKKQQLEILEGRKPRLFVSWKSLIVGSNLKTDFFQNIYGYKSNYSHSEFISVLQVKEGNYGYHAQNTRGHYLLFLLHGLLSKTIIEMKNYFPSTEKVFAAQNDLFKEEIICLNKHCCNTTMEKND